MRNSQMCIRLSRCLASSEGKRVALRALVMGAVVMVEVVGEPAYAAMLGAPIQVPSEAWTSAPSSMPLPVGGPTPRADVRGAPPMRIDAPDPTSSGVSPTRLSPPVVLRPDVSALGGSMHVKDFSNANLVIVRGERLSKGLRTWLARFDIDLVWAAHGTTPGHVRDVELMDDFESSESGLNAVLTEILGPFGLSAEISGNGRRVTVINADNAPN